MAQRSSVASAGVGTHGAWEEEAAPECAWGRACRQNRRLGGVAGSECSPARAVCARLGSTGVSKALGETACGQTEWPGRTHITQRMAPELEVGEGRHESSGVPETPQKPEPSAQRRSLPLAHGSLTSGFVPRLWEEDLSPVMLQ